VNWLDSADMAMLYKGPFATEFYRQLHTVVHKEYRSRKTWNEIGALLRNPAHLRGHLKQTCLSQLTLPNAVPTLDQLALLPNAIAMPNAGHG
jgi:hypothetical protein